MEIVRFTPENHIYIRESDGCRLMSSSHFYKQFGDFDMEASLSRKAVQTIFGATRYDKIKKEWNGNGGHIYDDAYIPFLESKVPNMETYYELREQFRKEWSGEGKKAAGKGTDIHAEKELSEISSGIAVQEFTGEVYTVMPHGKKEDGTNCNTVECLSDLPDGFYGEMLLWYFFPHKVFSKSMGCEICGLAGTVDRFFKKMQRVALEDYKSNKDLSGYSPKITNLGMQYHLPPFNHIPRSKRSKYHIQLNFYGWLVEQHGLDIWDLRLLHTPEKETVEQIPIPYEGHLVDLAVSNLLNSSL